MVNVVAILNCPTFSETTEDDVELPPEKKFKFKCNKCGMDYPTKHGLSIRKARWCKRRLNTRKPSRKCTVADKIIKRRKIKIKQDELPKVHIGNHELENVYTYTFTYLGTEISGDGNSEITAQHRCNVAIGKFNEHRSILTPTKLPIRMRLRLYTVLVVSTMIYGIVLGSLQLELNVKRMVSTAKC